MTKTYLPVFREDLLNLRSVKACGTLQTAASSNSSDYRSTDSHMSALYSRFHRISIYLAAPLILLAALLFSVDASAQCSGGDTPCIALPVTVTTAACASPITMNIGTGCAASPGTAACNYQNNRRDAFAVFTIAFTTDITIRYATINVNRNPIIHLYDGNTPAGCNVTTTEIISCVNNGGNGVTENLVQAALPPGTYYVRIQAVNNDTMDGSLCVFGSNTYTCQSITGDITGSAPAAMGGAVSVCPGETITFSGTGIYPQNGIQYPQSNSTSLFFWDFGDGQTQSGVNLTGVTHSYAAGGGYYVQLFVRDQHGCWSTNYENYRVQVSPEPDFTGTTPDSPFCFGSSGPLTLAGNATAVTWTAACETSSSDTLLIPDGTGTPYSSSLELNCYLPEQTLSSAGEILNICVNLEHSRLNDLRIAIECPNGQAAVLKAGGAGGNTFLGQPVSFGSPDANSANITPGTGFDYCFNTTPTYGTMASTAGTFQYTYTDASGYNHVNQQYLPAGSYASSDPLSNLVGCPLNGTWTIEVLDQTALSNGYAFAFALDLDPALAPPSWSFSNAVTGGVWSPDPTIVSQSGNTIEVQPGAPGVYVYTYTTTDSEGCQYSEQVTVTAGNAPSAGTGSSYDLCGPEGTLNLFTLLGGSPDAGGAWTDNEGTGQLSGSNLNTNNLAPGTYTFTYTVSGGGSCPDDSAIITINRTGGGIPQMNCPADISVGADPGTCGAAVNYSIGITDDCSAGPCAPPAIPGFTMVGTLNGHSYFRSATQATWAVANATANALGGHLLTVSSAAENNFFSGLGQHWIGMTDEVTEGTWVWVTGEPVIYTNWAPGEPNNSGNQDYALINWSGTRWDDQGAGVSHFYIIEFDCTYQLEAGLSSGSIFPVGTTEVTYSVIDGDGNPSPSCSFDVTVTDGIVPALVCPANIVSAAPSGQCSQVVTYTPPYGVDNCGDCQSPPALSGFTLLTSANGRAYYVSNGTANFATANAAAAATGGYLAAIESAAENTLIRNAMTSLGIVTYYIGLNDLATEGTYVWTNGQPLSYQNWNTGEPNNLGNEDAVQVLCQRNLE
jgi:hypothetical protein